MAVMVAPEYAAQKQEREHVIFVSKSEAKKREQHLLVSPDNLTANKALRKICFMLHALAQKYVPNMTTTFEDHATLVHCTKLLQELGLKPEISPRLSNETAGVGAEVIHSSFEYRQLRNKMMAGLSVIADLTERPASPGSPDYQRGVREGYRRASEVAVMFLADVDNGV